MKQKWMGKGLQFTAKVACGRHTHACTRKHEGQIFYHLMAIIEGMRILKYSLMYGTKYPLEWQDDFLPIICAIEATTVGSLLVLSIPKDLPIDTVGF